MEKYKHSGKIEILGIVYMIIFGITSASIFGMLYAYLVHFIPFIYINFFITLGFGFVVGFSTSFGGKLGKIRNNIVMLISGLLAGIIALYCSWVGYIFVSSGSDIWVFNPVSILALAKIIASIGSWSIFGVTFTGTLLYIVWIIEALMIVGTSTLVAIANSSTLVFCEKCNEWLTQNKTISHIEIFKNPDIQIKQLQQGDFSSLYKLKKTKNNIYLELEILHCHLCKQQHYVTVKLVNVTINKDNDETKKESELIERVPISLSVYTQLEKLEK